MPDLLLVNAVFSVQPVQSLEQLQVVADGCKHDVAQKQVSPCASRSFKQWRNHQLNQLEKAN